MRKLAPAGLAIAAATSAAWSTGSAQNYLWCLVNDLDFGSTSCGFVSREQYKMLAGSNVGNCIANPAYAAAREPPRKPDRSDR
jgi:hypothetical protein